MPAAALSNELSDNPLLDAVDALTRPRADVATAPIRVCAWPPARRPDPWAAPIEGEQLERLAYWRTEHPPLIEQLRDAAAGGTGRHSPSHAELSRIPINAGAIEFHAAIEKMVSEWFVELTGRPPYLLPEKTLRQWYLAFIDAQRRGLITDETETARLGTLRAWRLGIDRLFGPPDATHEVTAPCPSCGESSYFDAASRTELPHPIIVRAWDLRATGGLDHTEATCRFCGQSWSGGTQLRALAWELERASELSSSVSSRS